MRSNRGIKELIKGFSQKQRMMPRASRKGVQSALAQTEFFKKEWVKSWARHYKNE